MRIALTGATGFLGRYLARELATQGHSLRCWHRPTSDRTGFETIASAIEWLPGELGEPGSETPLVAGCGAVVHSALYHPDGRFMGGEGDLLPFVEKNVVGTLRLIEAARSAGVERFVFISTCAVHDRILPDRPLDETHPLWPHSHYGAHKAAIEKFVHSFGLGMGYPICALRPTGIYGVAHPAGHSKWYKLVESVVRGEPVTCRRGGKEVHARDVAKAVTLLLSAPGESIAGEAFNCCDQYISEWDVARMTKDITGSPSVIEGAQTSPKNEIQTGKLRSLGMTFGGQNLLRATLEELAASIAR